MKTLLWTLCLVTVIPSLLWGGAVTQVVTFSRDDFRFEKVGTYDLVTGKGMAALTDVGRPQLPVLRTSLAIPAGARVTALEVVALQQEAIPGSFSILPAQDPRKLNEPKEMLPLTKADPAVYGAGAPYPRAVAVLQGQGDLAGQQLAHVQVAALQYVPSEGRLLVNRRIEFVVQYVVDGPRPERMSRMSESTRGLYESMLRGMVLNPEAVIVEPTSGPQISALPAGDFDEVVITTNALKTYFASLVSWKKKKGVPDTVVTTEYIYANYTGADNQERIRNFIKDANTVWGTVYFLIGGDVAVVPVKTKYFSLTGENVPSDMYYGDYDDDKTCEVVVTRASVENSTEIGVFADKVLTYEKTPPGGGYPAKALLMGFDADSRTHCEDMKERIDTDYIPANFTVAKVYDSYGGSHETDCVNYLNAGQNLVNHADHGSYDFMGTGYTHHYQGLYNSDMDALTNDDRQSNLVSLACDVNGFDYYSDCIAEHFVHNSNGGGVSFTGNTRYGWYTPGNPYTLSGFYDMEWWESLFLQNAYHLGQTLADSRNRNPPGSDQTMQYIHWNLNTLGEAEMPIWTATPTHVTVNHPTSISIGSQSYMVTVTRGGSPVSGALVCVSKGAEVYAYGLTNASGQKTFTINPTTAGTMDVTVTAQNRFPYEGLCAVGGQLPVSLTLNRTSADPHARGGTLAYNAVFTNNTASTQTVYFWSLVTLPNGRERNGVVPQAITVTVPSYTKAYSHPIPMNAPYGTYTYAGYISATSGGPVMGQSSFAFNVQ
jgi:hypothetical protein